MKAQSDTVGGLAEDGAAQMAGSSQLDELSPTAKRPAGPAIPTPVSVSIIGTFLILLVGALYYARSFFLPLVLALLVALVFAPLVRSLSRRGVPPGLSAIALILLLGGGIVGASGLLSQPIASMVSDIPRAIDEVRERFAFLRRPFEMFNDASRELGSLIDGSTASDPERAAVAQPGLLSWAAGTAAGIGTTLAATLILAVFLLASSESLRHKLVHVGSGLSGKKKSLRVLRDIENEVSRYLLTITTINAGFGLCVGLAMLGLGMPNPLMWGIGAALHNFVPFIGGFVGMVLAVAVAAITFPTLLAAALPPLAYLGLQIVESNFVTPMILGRRLELNIVAMLIFLALTTWLWGIVGTIIGVPVLVVIKAFSDNFLSLSSLGEFLSAATADADEGEGGVTAKPPSIRLP